MFSIKSSFKPSGDQPKAIKSLVSGVLGNSPHQVLMGVTGSGKTYTVAHLIEQIQKPTLVIAHNKTLAAQLAQEYKDFFPNNAVHYFVSYYDYYQPEAYVPNSDTYIEKEAQINAEIDRLRHASTQSLLTRNDVIIVASVSCIYGLGSPEQYKKVHTKFEVGSKISRDDFIRKVITLYFERTNGELDPGKVRAIGNSVDIIPTNDIMMYRLQFKGKLLEKIIKINSITKEIIEDNVKTFHLFPAKHFVSSKAEREVALVEIEAELKDRLKFLKSQGRELEAERLRRRSLNDLSRMREMGYCNGIENYSRFFDKRKPGEPPHTLLSYFPKDKNGNSDFLTVIDESHVTVPQIAGMQAGDKSRKMTLIDYGFRLPSALDNRPLDFDEFNERVSNIIYVSATPGDYEKDISGKKNIIEQVIRPTGLVDPQIIVKPVVSNGNHKGQIKDFIEEAKKVTKRNERVLVTTLTKKTAEELSEYLTEAGIKSEYIHSDVKTMERIEILTEFRKGTFDCLVGVNLLREGLDLPEVSLVAILDADKEGFLRSTTSMIQTIGRAARHVNGVALLYADRMTGSLEKSIGETERRRKIQIAYNKKNNITPKSIVKKISDITEQINKAHNRAVHDLTRIDRVAYKGNIKGLIRDKRKQMGVAVKALDFETAAIIRDEIKSLEEIKK